MGVYNKLDVAFQEAMDQAERGSDKELADTVAWYRAHYQQIPAELMRAILTDNAFFEKAVQAWDSDRFPPKPAGKHVALELPVISRKALSDIRKYQKVVGWALIASACFIGVITLSIGLIMLALNP